MKCSVCDQQKGKRTCTRFGGEICSKCCGTSRDESCSSCTYYQPTELVDLRKIPRFYDFGKEVDNNPEFACASMALEVSIKEFDFLNGHKTFDSIAVGALKYLISKLMNQKIPETLNNQTCQLLSILESRIEEIKQNTLYNYNSDLLTKIINTVYYVAERRSKGGREYLDFLFQTLPNDTFVPNNKALSVKDIVRTRNALL